MRASPAEKSLSEVDSPIVPAIVTAITYSGSPGADGKYTPSQVKYTLNILNKTGGDTTMAGIVPMNHRPPESLAVIPCPVNSLVWGVSVGNLLMFNITEYPDMRACS